MSNNKTESAAKVKNPITPRSTVRPPAPPKEPFWTSYQGRNLVGIFTVVGTSVYMGGYTALHTILLERYKNIVRLYKNGFPTPLTPNEVVRCNETVADLNLNLQNPKMLDFFFVFGMDTFHAGSLKLRGGSIIGIPRYFSYSTKRDIEKRDLLVNNQPVAWGSEAGELLQDSLILSDRAKKFGIAREILMTDSYEPWYRGIFGGSSVLTYATITKVVNSKFYGFHRPKSFRYTVYALVGTLAFGMWTTMNDLYSKYMEKRVDSRVGNLNLEYARGGVEFYSKILQRNMALRSLMGPEGEKQFTFYGNVVEYIRQSHIPYSDRKKKLEEIAEKLNSQQKTEEKEGDTSVKDSL